jgi:hypothetical protein
VQKHFLDLVNGGVGYKANANALLEDICTQASALDGKLSNALRNILFGREMQEDLCARNIFRGRDLAMPSYAGVATCFGVTPDATVCFFLSWYYHIQIVGKLLCVQKLVHVHVYVSIGIYVCASYMQGSVCTSGNCRVS